MIDLEFENKSNVRTCSEINKQKKLTIMKDIELENKLRKLENEIEEIRRREDHGNRSEYWQIAVVIVACLSAIAGILIGSSFKF